MLAYEKGIPQSVFDAWSKDDKEYALFARRAMARMKNWEDVIAQREMDKLSKK